LIFVLRIVILTKLFLFRHLILASKAEQQLHKELAILWREEVIEHKGKSDDIFW
jgi:hypothetical protein